MMPIYFLRAGELGPVKIGWAINPTDRQRTLQTGHYEKLTLLRSFDGDRKLEAILHRFFASRRISGEWFEYHELMAADDVVDLAIIGTFKKIKDSKAAKKKGYEHGIDLSVYRDFRSWRIERGFTQVEAARKVGYARAQIQLYDEGKKTPPTVLMLAMHAISIGIELDEDTGADHTSVAA